MRVSLLAKLLAIIFLVVVVPYLLLGTFAIGYVRRLGEEVAAKSDEALVTEAEDAISRLAETSARRVDERWVSTSNAFNPAGRRLRNPRSLGPNRGLPTVAVRVQPCRSARRPSGISKGMRLPAGRRAATSLDRAASRSPPRARPPG